MSRLHYPQGFKVSVRNATYKRVGHYVVVKPRSGETVTVRIRGRA